MTKSIPSLHRGSGPWQKLFNEALESIPAHRPEWTDFNQHDPGVTLVQLFAWLSDLLQYRLGRVPERTRTILQKIAARLRKPCRPVRALVIGEDKKARSAPIRFLARKLGLRVCRVDLSAVDSKYIGETEKNLDRLLASAEASHAILLFDEADALFGRRKGVRDTRDRDANLEVNHLLQRLEDYHGLVILATNAKSQMDPAFLLRLRFLVDFPMPDPASRAALWRAAHAGSKAVEPASRRAAELSRQKATRDGGLSRSHKMKKHHG